MPRNTTVPILARTWTELTGGDTSSITFQAEDSQLLVKGTVGSVQPTDAAGAIAYEQFSGERVTPLIELWPGLTGVNRVWAFSQTSTQAMVSHA